MHDSMVRYFAGEKTEGVFFLAIGLAAVAAAFVLWRSQNEYRAMLWPLALLGLIEIAVGAVLLLRTDAQVAGFAAQITNDPAAYRAAEAARMTKVISSFHLFAAVEIAVLLAGVAMMLLLKQRRFPLHAVGLGLLLQSSTLLFLDQLAERRADHYLAGLTRE